MFCTFHAKISNKKTTRPCKNTCNSLAFFSKMKVENVTKRSQKLSLKIAFDEAFVTKVYKQIKRKLVKFAFNLKYYFCKNKHHRNYLKESSSLLGTFPI